MADDNIVSLAAHRSLKKEVEKMARGEQQLALITPVEHNPADFGVAGTVQLPAVVPHYVCSIAECTGDWFVEPDYYVSVRGPVSDECYDFEGLSFANTVEVLRMVKNRATKEKLHLELDCNKIRQDDLLRDAIAEIFS